MEVAKMGHDLRPDDDKGNNTAPDTVHCGNLINGWSNATGD